MDPLPVPERPFPRAMSEPGDREAREFYVRAKTLLSAVWQQMGRSYLYSP